ncbi:MAG: TetR/AcrR family transcriptional regulator [Chthoniobacteraceae bacterium]|nr:TetR/AcrR family transcriptional regulator [Chthoniobacteraceae bacterium]
MADIRLNTEQRHKAIVQAATPLFARKGFAGTTTKDIAAAAGVSEALLYKHFPSKQVIYKEILQSCCKTGDPILARVHELEASTSTLVHVIYILMHRLVLGGGATHPDWETRHRLMLNSLLEDGEFAMLVFDRVMELTYPTFQASMKAAEEAGDFVDGPGAPINRFWFVHHLGAILAYVRLPKKPLPHEGAIQEVVAQACWFVLRGIGLRDEAIKAHFNPKALALLQL